MNTTALQVIIHEQALRNNIRLLREQFGDFYPVIKADAYGHGCLHAARVLTLEGVTRMAVGTVGEAALLRSHHHDIELLALMGAISPPDVELAARHRVVVLLHNRESLALMTAWATATPTTPATALDVAIKIDTGMSRLGFAPDNMAALAAELAACPALRPVLALSHLAAADDPEHDAFTREQGERFARAVAILRATWPALRTSLGNSPGVLGWQPLAGDLPRPGLALYGINPFDGTCREALGRALSPVMEVLAPVLDVHDLAPGQSLGYGRTFTTQRPLRVAVIGAGYADGYHRALSNGGVGKADASRSAVLIHGQRAPILGRICMQMCLADVTHIPTVRVGEYAHLLGGEGPHAIRAEELARWAGTIPYEMVCAFGNNPKECRV